MDVNSVQTEQNAQASGSQLVIPEVNVVNVVEESQPQAPVEPKKKKEKREPAKVERPPGKTLLPVSKVQHIIKADKVSASPS